MLCTDVPVASQISDATPTVVNGGTNMSNMNGRDRRSIYDYLVKRDGEFCKHCKVSCKQRQLVVDHIDNYNSNNHPNNLQLLCRRCNYLKNPRLSEREPFAMCECEPIQHVSFSYITNEITINKEKEPLFRKYVEYTIDKNTEWEKEDLINSGSETVGVSIITAERYLKKMCSSTGKFMLVTKNNTDYVTKRNPII